MALQASKISGYTLLTWTSPKPVVQQFFLEKRWKYQGWFASLKSRLLQSSFLICAQLCKKAILKSKNILESILQSPKGLLEVEDIAIAIYMITLLLFIAQPIMVTLNHCEFFSFVIEKYQFPFTLIFRESNGDITSFMKREIGPTMTSSSPSTLKNYWKS